MITHVPAEEAVKDFAAAAAAAGVYAAELAEDSELQHISM